MIWMMKEIPLGWDWPRNSEFSSLPEGLPVPLKKVIKEPVQAARAAERESKGKSFTQDTGGILLDKEMQIWKLSSQICCEVHGQPDISLHACPAARTPWSNLLNTFISMNCRVHLKEPLEKLEEATGRAMPEQMATHQDECQA